MSEFLAVLLNDRTKTVELLFKIVSEKFNPPYLERQP